MLSPEEFFRLALDSGATVELVDGALRAEVKPRIEIRVGYTENDKPVETPPVKSLPRERVDPDRSYPLIKKACEPWTSSHIAHIAAALAVMHGARTGDWSAPGVDKILGMIQATPPVVDMPTLISCTQRATRYKQANKVDGERLSMSTGALVAAMYDAMAVDEKYKSVADLESHLNGKPLLNVATKLAANADSLGGSRSVEFRKQSYVQFLQVFTRLK